MRLEGRPTCAVCHKPVEKLQRLDGTYDCRVTFRVTCHGESETVRVDEKDLCGTAHVEFGEAFRSRKQLTAGGEYRDGKCFEKAKEMSK